MDPAYNNLALLKVPTEDGIVASLEKRFHQGLIYTPIAASVLVQINPHFPGEVDLADATIQDHVNLYKDNLLTPTAAAESDNTAAHQAHVLHLATSAFLHMRRTGQDQAIITSGQSGSGKTEGANQAIRHLLALSSQKKEAKIQAQILYSNAILRAFGHAKTTVNHNASRYGRFTEVQFNERGRLLGAKTLDYFLEKRRVTHTPAEERNFHIFYALLAGATPEERAHLHLNDTVFQYLTPKGAPSSISLTSGPDSQEDLQHYNQLKAALKVLGYQKKQVAQIFQLVAAILHLGNLTFAEDEGNPNDACVVRNVYNLIFVAELLGVDPNALQNTLTYKTKLIRRELCSVYLDEEGAAIQRDELSQALYSLLFSWMVEYLNVKLCHDSPANFIGVLDLFGFQTGGSSHISNGLDQFCMNYANEKMHHFFLQQVFEIPSAELEMDGIQTVPKVQFFDNSACMTLLGQGPDTDQGLIGIMSRPSTTGVVQKTDAAMLEAMSRDYARHDSLQVDRDRNHFGAFTIQHFRGPVKYSVEGWLEQNIDNLSSDFVTLFRGGSGVAPSTNTFMQGLFTDKALTTESHPRNDSTIVAAQQSIKPKRAPSMRRPKKENIDPATSTTKVAAAAVATAASPAKVISVAAQMQSALSELCDTLSDTTPWFLVCLQSNSTSSPNHFDTAHVKSQVRSVCLAQVARRLAYEYTVSCTFEEFVGRYDHLLVTLELDLPLGQQVEPKKRVESVKRYYNWTIQDANLGKSRIFMAENAWRTLETSLKELDMKDKKIRKPSSKENLTVSSGLAGGAAVGTLIGARAMGSNPDLDVNNLLRDGQGEVLNMSEDDLSNPSYSSNIGGMAERPLLASMNSHDSGSGQVAPLQQQQLQQLQQLQYMQQAQYTQQQQQGGPGLGYYPPLYPAQPAFLNNERYENQSFYSGEDTQSEYDPFQQQQERYMAFEHEGSVYGGSEVYRPGTRNMFRNEKVGDNSGLQMESLSDGLDGAGGSKEKKDQEEEEDVPEKENLTPARRNWVFLTFLLTWWIPGICLRRCGGMARKDIRMAWREKVALCILIGFLSLVMIFYITTLGELICPHQYVYGPGELSDHGPKSNSPLTSIRGEVFDLDKFRVQHSPSIVTKSQLFQYAGEDATQIFPVQPSALCDGLGGYGSNSIDPLVQMPSFGAVDPNSVYHDFRSFRNDSRPDWYYEKMVFMRGYRVGFMAFPPSYILSQAADDSTKRRWAILNGNVYDMTDYVTNGRQGIVMVKPGTAPPTGVNTAFMEPSVVDLFATNAGEDVTAKFDALPLDQGTKDAMSICLRNLFFVGRVDMRTSFKCQFANYMLLVPSILIVCTIAFKFLAALQLGSKREPEEHDKFIILQVPCYTEGEESIKKTLDSLASLRYDDKRKLLFVIADGMIIGSGNDRPTPRIVLDILGVDPNVDPEPLSFLSLGDGNKQHNMGKVYSGLYEHNGHVVPYVVVVKVGAPTERQRPGNRGKRDSQMILMRFLNKVHFNSAMTPLELEMYHQIKNVIGVNPSFYEYTLMVDSDTEVLPDSLNRMVSVFLHDTKVMGLCGETQIANEKDSWVTMMQVYEYFISHHLAKAFESLFGSVTCLPGCFCMYRIRTPTKSTPLLISNSIIEDYSENKVDTLHKKNLLHLGEDRYLTTLMLKHFPQYKMTFTPDAQCRTNVPDQWKVLLSQRRRWINSTVHNLMELVFLPQLCGFCCFSMRFIVMIDLFATLIMPVTVVYIVYLIYCIAVKDQAVPVLAIILMAAVYGLQAIIFILRRKWEHIGWMIVYILAIPMFSFYLPLYSFWHFDDFSWGNTRMVVGEKGRKRAVAADEVPFDPKSIPQKKWSDYEQELWEVQTMASFDSKRSRRNTGGSVVGGPHGGGGVYGQGGPGSVIGSVYASGPLQTSGSIVGGYMPPQQSATLQPFQQLQMQQQASLYGGGSRAGSVIGGGQQQEMSVLQQQQFQQQQQLLQQQQQMMMSPYQSHMPPHQ